MRLAIIGSRRWPREEEQRVIDYVNTLAKDTVVITGGWPTFAGPYHVVEATPGIDRIAWKAAEAAGLVTCLVAGSKTHKGKLAGLQRNPIIITLAEALVAFWDGESRGTAWGLVECARQDKRAIVIAPNGATYEDKHWQARAKWVLSSKKG